MDEGLGDADFLDEAVGTPEALIEREGTQDGAAGGRALRATGGQHAMRIRPHTT
jgi:hypothetical protein